MAIYILCIDLHIYIYKLDIRGEGFKLRKSRYNKSILGRKIYLNQNLEVYKKKLDLHIFSKLPDYKKKYCL